MEYEKCKAYKIKLPNGICMGDGEKCQNCPAYIRYLEVIKKENNER